MGTTVTVKGQVTVPKPVRDRMGLVPGSHVESDVDGAARVTLRKSGHAPDIADRLARAIGSATELKDMTTDEIMILLRGEREDP